MAKQKSLKEAHEQGYLELSNWGELMVQRIKMNYNVQKIYKGGNTGPYRDYWIVNMARRGDYRSTGESFNKIYSKVHAGAGGNTVAIDFFFRNYLYFVDWGVGKGQKIPEVPRKGSLGKGAMKHIYAHWNGVGDRQRRPVVFGAIKGSRFFLGNILQDYWGKEAELAVLYGLGYKSDTGEFVEFTGVE